MRSAIALLAILVPSQLFSQQSGWEQLESLKLKERISLRLQRGEYLEGRFNAWTPESVEIVSGGRTHLVKREQVERVYASRKGSRWKTAMWGALVGFGAGFSIGAASAGYIADQNNPRFTTRAGIGGGLGLFGAGIGAGIGALAGGKRTVIIYNARSR